MIGRRESLTVASAACLAALFSSDAQGQEVIGQSSHRFVIDRFFERLNNREYARMLDMFSDNASGQASSGREFSSKFGAVDCLQAITDREMGFELIQGAIFSTEDFDLAVCRPFRIRYAFSEAGDVAWAAARGAADASSGYDYLESSPWLFAFAIGRSNDRALVDRLTVIEGL